MALRSPDDDDPFEIDDQAAHLNMTPEQEGAFYADPDKTPQGPPTRRCPRLSDPVPVRLPPDVLEQVRQRARADGCSVSSWVRRAVEHEVNNRSA